MMASGRTLTHNQVYTCLISWGISAAVSLRIGENKMSEKNALQVNAVKSLPASPSEGTTLKIYFPQ